MIEAGAPHRAQERNLLRRFVRAGRPVALGLHVLGDARCQTHNVYGFGTALAFSQAMTLADILAELPTDPLVQALALEERVAGEVAGLYRYALEHDRASWRKNRGEPEWEAVTGEGDEGWLELLVAPAANGHANVFRAYTRRWTLLDPPDALAQNAAVLERVRELSAVRQPTPEQPRSDSARRETSYSRSWRRRMCTLPWRRPASRLSRSCCLACASSAPGAHPGSLRGAMLRYREQEEAASTSA